MTYTIYSKQDKNNNTIKKNYYKKLKKFQAFVFTYKALTNTK